MKTVLLVSEISITNDMLMNSFNKRGFDILITDSFEKNIKKAIFVNLPDVLLVDYDIITISLDPIIKYFKNEYNSKKKIVFMATKMTSEEKSAIINKGVDLIIDKPFNFTYLCDKINDILSNNKNNLQNDMIIDEYNDEKIFKWAQNEIVKMGVCINSKAWVKLCDVITLIVKRDGNISNIRKNIFRDVAQKYNTTDEGIDSTIRRCICLIWKNGDREYLKNYFYIYTDYDWDSKRPSNKQFLKIVTNNIINYQEKKYKCGHVLSVTNKK